MLAALALALLGACGGGEYDDPEATLDLGTPATSGGEESINGGGTGDGGTTQGADTDTSAGTVTISYACADGESFTATVAQGSQTWARVEVGGEEALLERASSGGGARYLGEGYEYRAQGDRATLLREGAVIRADCTPED